MKKLLYSTVIDLNLKLREVTETEKHGLFDLIPEFVKTEKQT